MYNAAVWLRTVKEHYGDRLQITWRHFSLEQVNSKEEGWKVWDEPDDFQGRSILSLRAAEAARRQGEEAFERFHLALLTARHGGRDRLPLNEIEPLLDVARDSGLDVQKLERDMKDRSLLDKIAEDHTEGVESYGMFGTPTFLFENGTAAYLKIFIPPEDEAVEAFDAFYSLFGGRSYVGEVKRPQPPWPKGAVG